jgi:ABC-type multidrug transport system fused ATPase/permease subunit
VLAWLATAGFAAAGAGLAYSVKPIFDDVLIRRINTAQVGATILALYLIKGLCAYASATLIASVGQRAVSDLRNALYEHVLNQSVGFLSRQSTGGLMSHFTRTWRRSSTRSPSWRGIC